MRWRNGGCWRRIIVLLGGGGGMFLGVGGMFKGRSSARVGFVH